MLRFFFLIFFFSKNLKAENIFEKKFIVEKDFDPDFQQTFPIYIENQEKIYENNLKVVFDFSDINVDMQKAYLKYEFKKIEKSILEKKYKAYLKVGYNSSPAPIFSGCYCNKINEDIYYLISIFHNSLGRSWSHFESYKNNLFLQIVKIFDDFILASNFDLSFSKCYYLEFEKDEISYENQIPISLKFFGKNYFEKNFFYKFLLDFSHFKFNEKIKESYFLANSNFFYDINENNRLEANFDFFISSHKNENFDINRFYFFSKLKNNTNWNNWIFGYGAAIVIDNEKSNLNLISKSENFKKNFFDIFAPNIFIGYKWNEKICSGIKIEEIYQINTFKNEFEKFNYIDKNIFILNESLVFYGFEFFGNIFSNIYYKISLGFANPKISEKIFLYSKEYCHNSFFSAVASSYYQKVNIDYISTDLNHKLFIESVFHDSLISSKISYTCKLFEKFLLNNELKIENIETGKILGKVFKKKDQVQKIDLGKYHHIYDLKVELDYIFSDEWNFFISLENILFQNDMKTNPFDKSQFKISLGAKYMFL